ncbi:hypothetical protein SOCE26_006650 [Sorangium cellulosum]|uniref:PEGA domain-containing protein n=1 Tax=Sorangium cellulosum TaxID=56 RepID=A0A2L0EJ01_SORCE|nr:PEGA domain-containing protein [Sorangium cellulosum]AUX39281.1 hypothetical protein SOCE26_006650 [Sorangium cellulosum]
MRSRSGRLTILTSAAMVSGLLTLTNVGPASAQADGKQAAPPAAKPAAQVTPGATPAAPPPAGTTPPAAGATPPAAGATPPAAGTTPPAAGATPPAAGTPATAAPGKAGDPAKAAAAAKPKKPLTEKQKKDEAKKLYKEAEARFDKGEYATAAELYRQADAYVPGAAPKYKLALSLDKQGLAVEAVAAWQSFLDSKPDADKFKDKITEAQGRVEALKKTPAKVKVAITPPTANAKISVDGVAQTGPELSVPPGKHTLNVSAEGFVDASQEIEVTFAENREVNVQLTQQPPAVAAVTQPPPATTTPPATPPPATQPPPAPPVEARSLVPAFVTFGVAGVGAVVGTIFGIQALSAQSDFEKNPTHKNADAVDRNALICDMSFAVAITFGATGAVLLLTGDDTPAETKAAASTGTKKAFVAPFVSPTGGGAAAQFTF